MDSESEYAIYAIMKDDGWDSQKINDLIYKMSVCSDRAQHVDKKLQHQRVFGNKPTLLITISFDKALDDAHVVPEMERFMRMFKESDYKWCENAIYSLEFYSKEGWNPHIHICCDKNGSASQIAQAIKRSPGYKKSKVYNVNVKAGADKFHIDYVKGIKKEEKLENCDKDEQFRKEKNLKSYYSL